MSQTIELRKFVAPEFVFGAGSLELAGTYARNLGGRRLLVVSDPGVIAAGWTRRVTDCLEREGVDYALFADVTANPRVEEVAAGVEAFRREGCNALLAVGGGSPIDCAKGIGILATNPGSILDYVGVDGVEAPIPPLICIPTTGGTGADVSQFAILNDLARRSKVAIVSKAVLPDVSLVDPATLATMPPFLSACTGLDALTHAIEAFVSNAHSPMTDLHALEALRLIAAHLGTSVKNPDDGALREKIMLASLLAGLAFSNAILGAVHAMAHSLGGYLDLAHGECNAILLEHVVGFNFQAAPERFVLIGEALGLPMAGLAADEQRKALVEELRRIKTEAGFDRTLSALGVGLKDIPMLSRQALQDPCLVTNPRRPDRREIEALYEDAL